MPSVLFPLEDFPPKLFHFLFVLQAFLSYLLSHSNLVLDDLQFALRSVLNVLLPCFLALFT